MRILLLYLNIINLFTLFLMIVDKRKAINNSYRIKEKTLLSCILLGGFLGSLLALYLIKHKKKKPKFIIIIFLSSILWILVLISI